MDKYKISLVDAGDSAVSIRFPQEISEKVHREVIYYLDLIKAGMRIGKLSGVLDIVPSYAAILLRFDPLITDGETIKNTLEEILVSSPSSSARDSQKI